MQNLLEISSKNTILGPETCEIRPKSVAVLSRLLSYKYGPIRAHMGPSGPIWAQTRTGPQPGLGPKSICTTSCNVCGKQQRIV